MKIVKKLIAAAASAGLIGFYSTAPALAAITITESGNGSGSTNGATITTTQTTTITQTNDASINNTSDVSAETGGNTADGNTGGNVTVDTGNVNATSETTNAVNENFASVGCDCIGNITANIADNGSGSNNDFSVENTNDYTATQFNTASVTNTTTLDADSGDNSGDDNTNGEVSVETGDVNASASITNDSINYNEVVFGDSADAADILVNILRNGSDSTTDVDLTFDNDVTFSQVNDADVLNTLTMTAESGGNSADANTGGNVTVDTGNVTADATVDNAINFNYAEAGCCVEDVTGAISDNGSGSDNTIDYTNDNTVSDSQFNDCGTGSAGGDCDTLVVVDGDSGDNSGDDNTNGEVKVETGSSTVDVDVINDINVNDYQTL